MHRKIRRYKVNFVSTSGKKFSFKTLAIHQASVIPKVLSYLEKKLKKVVTFEENNLLIDSCKIATLESITKMAKEK